MPLVHCSLEFGIGYTVQEGLCELSVVGLTFHRDCLMFDLTGFECWRLPRKASLLVFLAEFCWRQSRFSAGRRSQAWSGVVCGMWLCITWCGLAAPLAAQNATAGTQQMSARIDELLESRLAELGWQAAGSCSDAVFVRRAHLDLTGWPPSAAEALDFVQDTSPDKHEQLIDRLLESPLCATHLSSQWSAWMLPEDNTALPGLGSDGLQSWLRSRFAENLRYDRLVADLLVASGPVQAGPTEFFVALEGKPEKIAAKTARVFMGVQLDCAECHDHPFDEWSQREFWSFAAYFAQLSASGEQAMMGRGEVTDVDSGDVMLPGTDEVVPPQPLVKTGQSGLGRGTRRQQLTLWLTAPENPFLARAAVNRVWALLFGRGLIEPIDDMRSLEMASHPQLLKELSEYFAAEGYDLRKLMAVMAKTKAYRRSSLHLSGTPPEDAYAVMAAKPLTELQLSHSISKVAREIVGGENAAAEAALANQLGKLRGDASEAKLGMVSALVTLHGDTFDQVSREGTSRLLKALEAPYFDQRKQFRWLFLATLNRVPSRDEEAAFSALFDGTVSGADGADVESESQTQVGPSQVPWQSDLLWALINSTEFAMTP